MQIIKNGELLSKMCEKIIYILLKAQSDQFPNSFFMRVSDISFSQLYIFYSIERYLFL